MTKRERERERERLIAGETLKLWLKFCIFVAGKKTHGAVTLRSDCYLSNYLAGCLSVCLSIQMSIWMINCLSVYPCGNLTSHPAVVWRDAVNVLLTYALFVPGIVSSDGKFCISWKGLYFSAVIGMSSAAVRLVHSRPMELAYRPSPRAYKCSLSVYRPHVV